jgi:hypothetical protein
MPPPTTGRTNVSIDDQAIQKVVDAIKGLTDIIGGRIGPDEREPSADQARAILDYELLSQALGRPGRVVRVVGAERKPEKLITFKQALPDGVTRVAVTPARGAREVADVDRGNRKAKLQTTPDEQPLVRVELQTAAGVPVAICPRLPALPTGGVE